MYCIALYISTWIQVLYSLDADSAAGRMYLLLFFLVGCRSHAVTKYGNRWASCAVRGYIRIIISSLCLFRDRDLSGASWVLARVLSP